MSRLRWERYRHLRGWIGEAGRAASAGVVIETGASSAGGLDPGLGHSTDGVGVDRCGIGGGGSCWIGAYVTVVSSGIEV